MGSLSSPCFLSCLLKSHFLSWPGYSPDVEIKLPSMLFTHDIDDENVILALSQHHLQCALEWLTLRTVVKSTDKELTDNGV